MNDYYSPRKGWFLVPVEIVYHDPSNVVFSYRAPTQEALDQSVRNCAYSSEEEAKKEINKYRELKKAAIALFNELPPCTGDLAKAAHRLAVILGV